MSVNLKKGQKVELRKNNGGTLRKVMVGLGWDEAQQKKGLFASRPQDVDCDASAILCINGRLMYKGDLVFYNNLRHGSGAVQHMGDNLTGAGEGDDEQIMVDLTALPGEYDRLVFVVTIYQAKERGQHFGLIRNCFIRICDAETGQELCRYDLSENDSGMTGLIFGEICRQNGTWKFNAIGRPTTDNSISEMAKRFL